MLLLVVLDYVGGPYFRLVRVIPEFAQCPALRKRSPYWSSSTFNSLKRRRSSSVKQEGSLTNAVMRSDRPRGIIPAVPLGELKHRMEIAASRMVGFQAAELRHSCQIVHVSPIHLFLFWTWRIYGREERLRKRSTTRAPWRSLRNPWATSDFGSC